MDTHAQAPPDAAVLRRERDLYLRLLELGHESTLAPFLKDALALLVEITGAQEGYLELYDDDDEPSEGPAVVDRARAQRRSGSTTCAATISRGIIAESIASGRTIVTAGGHPRPALQPSRERPARGHPGRAVRAGRRGPPARRALPDGRAAGQPFSEEDRARVELVTRHLAPSSIACSSRRGRGRATTRRARCAPACAPTGSSGAAPRWRRCCARWRSRRRRRRRCS